jgi:potassium-dependent mechanosensitive channel
LRIAAAVPLLERAIFVAALLAAILIAGWLLRSGRLPPLTAVDIPRGWGQQALAVGGRALGWLLVAALTADLCGYTELGRDLGGGLISTAYIGQLLYAAYAAIDGLVAYLLRVRPLRLLRMVQRHRELIQHRIRPLVGLAGIALWAFFTIDRFGLAEPLARLAGRVGGVDLVPGPLAVTLGDFVLCGVIIVVAFKLSAFIRFALEEDVYPRFWLGRGIPYALSALLNYGILFLGFLIAVTSLGVDLTRATVLAGAFGLGIGFGLQNIVNNFISGLILLIERPFQVGDVVQIGDTSGEVRRVGIRSSTVWTYEGAEMIIPNGTLISDRVTNWTLSDRMRRITIPVGTAYGNAPEKVREILLATATTHPRVLAQPAPIALFIGFGDSALSFELRVWTDRFEDWLVIRSELGGAVYDALNAAGIEIPFPQRVVQIKEGTPALPPRADPGAPRPT